MEEKKLIIVKGLIDGHDKKQSSMYGAFLGVVSPSGVKYTGSIFSFMPLSQDMTWHELLEILREERTQMHDPALLHMESQLENFLNSNKLLISTAKSMNSKQLERDISSFCAKEMGLRSVTLIEIATTNEKSFSSFLTKQEEEPGAEEVKDLGEDAEGTDDGAAEGATARSSPTDLSVSCDPVLDPAHGIAISDLSPGVSVICRLPELSIYHQLFASRFPDFDGSIAGEITGIKINEFGSAVVGLNLAEGISGVMKLSASVRVRLANKESDLKKDNESWLRRKNELGLPLGFILGAGAILVLLGLMGALVYFFS